MGQNQFKGVFIVVGIVMLLQASAYAADSTATMAPSVGTTQSNQNPNPSSFMNDLYLSYFAIYHGPNMAKLDSPYSVDAKGKPNSRQVMNLDSEITAAYMLTPTTGIGPVVPFLLYTALGNGASLGDVGIKAFNKNTVKTANLSANTNIILQLPTNDYSKARNMKFAVKTTPNLRYNIPNSRFTIGSWTEAKAYLGVEQAKTFKLWAGPYVNYQLSPNLSLNLGYEIEANHMLHASTFDFTMYQNDFIPGFIYMITPKIILNPYVQIFTGENITFASDRMALGAVLSASI